MRGRPVRDTRFQLPSPNYCTRLDETRRPDHEAKGSAPEPGALPSRMYLFAALSPRRLLIALTDIFGVASGMLDAAAKSV